MPDIGEQDGEAANDADDSIRDMGRGGFESSIFPMSRWLPAHPSIPVNGNTTATIRDAPTIACLTEMPDS
jgi:hypothetical protein